MWYRDPQDVIALERRMAGLEVSKDALQQLVFDCIITPGAMFARAIDKKV